MSDAVISAPDEGASTKQERVDFLKQMIAFSEGNVRAYDTKAQISLAAFVLSVNPLVAMVNLGCSTAGAKLVLMFLVPTYLATILTYLWVIWPVVPPAERLTKGLKLQHIFFIHDPLTLGSTGLTDKLKKLDIEPELTAEALKLAYIRRVKARRFKLALVVTPSTYLQIALVFFFVGRCF